MRLCGLVRALVAEGATPGMILAAVEAIEAERAGCEDDADGRRAAARVRQRASRARRQAMDGCMAEGGGCDLVDRCADDGVERADVTLVTVTSCDSHTMSHDVTVTSPPLSPPLSPPDPQTPPPLYPPPLLQQPRAAGEGRQDAHRSRADLDAIEARCREAAGVVDNPSPGFVVLSPLLGLLDAGFDLEADILPVLRAKRGRRAPYGWGWYVEAIREARARRVGVATVPAAVAVTPIDRRDFRSVMAANGFRAVPEHYDILCRAWFLDRRWPLDRGPKPGEPDGFVPVEHAMEWLARHPECDAAVA